MKKTLKEQYTEANCTIEQLDNLFIEKALESRKKGYSIEFIKQKPIYDNDGNVISVTKDFPAELNIYVIE